MSTLKTYVYPLYTNRALLEAFKASTWIWTTITKYITREPMFYGVTRGNTCEFFLLYVIVIYKMQQE